MWYSGSLLFHGQLSLNHSWLTPCRLAANICSFNAIYILIFYYRGACIIFFFIGSFSNRTWMYLVIYKSGCDSELLDEFITCHKPQDMPLHSVHTDGTNKLSQQKIGTSALRSINYCVKCEVCESAAGAIPRKERFIIKICCFSAHILNDFLMWWVFHRHYDIIWPNDELLFIKPTQTQCGYS